MSCGTCLKVIVFVTNILFALASLALIGIGVAVLLVVKEDEFVELGAEAGPVAVIAVGAVAFVVSFFGCCGAVMDNKCMLFTYSILLIILMNVKTALATIMFVARDYVSNSLKQLVQNMFDNNPESFPEIEKMFSCCGTAGPQSYTNIKLPASCCGDATCTILNSYPGCNTAVNEFVVNFGFGIAACCLILVAIELIAVIFGLCLANHVSNKYRSRY